MEKQIKINEKICNRFIISVFKNGVKISEKNISEKTLFNLIGEFSEDRILSRILRNDFINHKITTKGFIYL